MNYHPTQQSATRKETSLPNSQTGFQRLHGMDALRAIAMWLGVVLHAAMAYQIYPRAGWPQDVSFDSFGFDLLYDWIHAFRMPLFFLVAGFFARFLYLKIGKHPFIQHRLNRILVPFVCSLVLIVPLSNLPFDYIKSLHSGYANLEAFKLALKNTVAWNGMYHLWFLYNLMIYYVAMVIGKRVLGRKRVLSLKNGLTLSMPTLIAFSFLLFLILLVFFDSKVEPWTGLLVKPGQLVYYGFFFLIGYIIQAYPESLKPNIRQTWWLLLLGTLLTGINAWIKYTTDILTTISEPLYISIFQLGLAFQTVFLIFGVMGFFLIYFSRESKIIRYLSDSSYWFYLIHFPIVASLQIALFNSFIPGAMRFWLVIAITTTVSLVSYHYLVRYTIIGKTLHGIRQRSGA